MKKIVFVFAVCILTACTAVFLSACGCSDDDSVLNNVLTGVWGDSFSESDQEIISSLIDGSAYNVYVNGESYEDYDSIPEEEKALTLSDIPEDTLNGLIAGGQNYLFGLAKTDPSWTKKWYSGNGSSILYKTLESVDYVGCCLFTDDETMLNDGLYLVYDIHVLQAGSFSRENPGIIMTDQTEFEYYQYVLINGTSDYDNRTISFSSSFVEGDHTIIFDTYAQGGFNIITTVSKQYSGYNTLEELYDDLINLMEDYCTLAGSTV